MARGKYGTYVPVTAGEKKERSLRPIVKICGLMRADDIQMCVRHGADIIGFVADYPRQVPWDIGAQAAGELIQCVSKPAQTCIVTGGKVEKIIKLALETEPDYIQLHFNETLGDTVYIVRELKKKGIKVIKTLFPGTPDIEEAAKKFSQTGIYALLLDHRTPGNAVTGGAADLLLYRKIRESVNLPIILAGGITPENVNEILLHSEAPFIDLMTGVESSPGVKDEAKMNALFAALECTDQSLTS